MNLTTAEIGAIRDIGKLKIVENDTESVKERNDLPLITLDKLIMTSAMICMWNSMDIGISSKYSWNDWVSN